MELIQVWLAIIGLGTVVYGVIRLGVWAYEYDLRHGHNRPSVFNPWKYHQWRKQVLRGMAAEK